MAFMLLHTYWGFQLAWTFLLLTAHFTSSQTMEQTTSRPIIEETSQSGTTTLATTEDNTTMTTTPYNTTMTTTPYNTTMATTPYNTTMTTTPYNTTMTTTPYNTTMTTTPYNTTMTTTPYNTTMTTTPYNTAMTTTPYNTTMTTTPYNTTTTTTSYNTTMTTTPYINTTMTTTPYNTAMTTTPYNTTMTTTPYNTTMTTIPYNTSMTTTPYNTAMTTTPYNTTTDEPTTAIDTTADDTVTETVVTNLTATVTTLSTTIGSISTDSRSTRTSTEVFTTTMSTTTPSLPEIPTSDFFTSTSPLTKPLIGPIPEPVYPDLDGDAQKVVVVEMKVMDDNSCFPDFLQCDTFEGNFVDQVTSSYENLAIGAVVNVIEIRNETEEIVSFSSFVIVRHNVSYIWNELDQSQRSLSANDIYDMTVGPGIDNGKIGNLTVTSDCLQCTDPEEITSLCIADDIVLCPSLYLESSCLAGIPVCQSQCLSESSYCGKNGVCTHIDPEAKPTCGCLHDKDLLYFGEYCHLQLDKLWFLIGVSIGGFLVILLIVVLCVCLIVSRRNRKPQAKVSGTRTEEELGMQSYAYTNEVYDTTNPDAVVSPVQRDRPYSYLYANGSNTASSSQTFGNIAEEAAKIQTDKHKNSAFWGNLTDDSSRPTQMQPILTHIDTSQGYRIPQRPTSQSLTSSLPEPDYSA